MAKQVRHFKMKAKAPKIPRPEHPRPQFEREDWINLNGKWSFDFDFGVSGLEREFQKSVGFTKQINVPFCPESKLGISSFCMDGKNRFAGGCAPPNPAPLAAAGVRGESGRGCPADSAGSAGAVGVIGADNFGYGCKHSFLEWRLDSGTDGRS